MAKRYSIAEARHDLAAIVHELEREAAIELTRRGEPVAVLMSVDQYKRLASPHMDFWTAYEEFRQRYDLDALQLDDVFDDVRDRSVGREVEL